VEIFQSHEEMNNSWKNPISGPHLMASLMPKALDNGNQNTVGHADTQMYRQCGGRYQPAVKTRMRNDALL
jgi:hypothetical protein